MKKFIPNLMTLTHLSFGMFAIICSFEADYKKATLYVIFAMILDGLDGRVARALHVSGDFGKELDSLADVVTFGVAPALILYNAALYDFGYIGLWLTMLFPICGVLRLARFNTNGYKISNYFVGLPITAAGGILAVIATYHEVFHPILMIVFSLLLSYLMISHIKYPNFKKIAVPSHAYFIVPTMFLCVYAIYRFFPGYLKYTIFVPLVYFISFLLYKLKQKSLHGEEDTEELEDDELEEK